MHIVVDGIIFEMYTYGGIARMFNNILPLLCDLDPKLRVQLFFNKQPHILVPEHPQISILSTNQIQKYMRPWRLWRPFRKVIIKLLRNVWFSNTRSSIWFSTYFSRPPINWNGSEVVMVHDLIYELFPDLLPDSNLVINSKRDCIIAADKVFCNSNTTRRDLLTYYPRLEKDVITIHLAKDNIFKQRRVSEIRRFMQSQFILFLGARNYYKGFIQLLDAYSAWEGRDSINLIVVGRAWSTEELQIITAKGLESKVQLMENVDDDTLCDLYNQAEGFIYPSVYEGFGIPLLEAMACGCPIVASRIPSTLEVAGDVPIYFDPGEILSLVQALDRLRSREGVQAKVAEGLEIANKYSWEKTAKAFYEELKNLQKK